MRRVGEGGKIPEGFREPEKKFIREVGNVVRAAINFLEACGKGLVTEGMYSSRNERQRPPKFSHSVKVKKKSDLPINVMTKKRG